MIQEWDDIDILWSEISFAIYVNAAVCLKMAKRFVCPGGLVRSDI